MRDGGARDIKYRRHVEVDGIESFEYEGPAKYLARHVHAEYQLTLYQASVHRFEIRGRSFDVGPHSGVIIQAGEAHSSEPASDAAIALRGVYLDARAVEEAAESLWHVRASVVFERTLIDSPTTSARLCAAHVALARGGLESEVAFRAALVELLERCAIPAGPRRVVRTTAGIMRARELLNDRAGDELSLAELANVAGVSRYHLIRLFHKQYGLTPFAYQRNLRVQRAREHLARGGSIASAAAAAGFADQSHLGRSFLSVMGVTPGQYRGSIPAATRRVSAAHGACVSRVVAAREVSA
jgi:AraC-like DNA-binding protein